MRQPRDRSRSNSNIAVFGPRYPPKFRGQSPSKTDGYASGSTLFQRQLSLLTSRLNSTLPSNFTFWIHMIPFTQYGCVSVVYHPQLPTFAHSPANISSACPTFHETEMRSCPELSFQSAWSSPFRIWEGGIATILCFLIGSEISGCNFALDTR